eukprot:6179195-Pleurochrysis_carterae.AAC.1
MRAAYLVAKASPEQPECRGTRGMILWIRTKALREVSERGENGVPENAVRDAMQARTCKRANAHSLKTCKHNRTRTRIRQHTRTRTHYRGAYTSCTRGTEEGQIEIGGGLDEAASRYCARHMGQCSNLMMRTRQRRLLLYTTARVKVAIVLGPALPSKGS